ncbi:MAG: hypothetical protein HYT80_10885 [Euryarchaeota archaeon]|nr:hypothetical protein [Euryarchaeota archaeon]
MPRDIALEVLNILLEGGFRKDHRQAGPIVVLEQGITRETLTDDFPVHAVPTFVVRRGSIQFLLRRDVSLVNLSACRNLLLEPTFNVSRGTG